MTLGVHPWTESLLKNPASFFFCINLCKVCSDLENNYNNIIAACKKLPTTVQPRGVVPIWTDVIDNGNHARTWFPLTIFSSDGVRDFRLSMSSAVSMSVARTFVWASLHLVRRCGVCWTISHLVIAVKVARLALWLIFMGLHQIYIIKLHNMLQKSA